MFWADGKKDLLAAIHRSRRTDGHLPPIAMVEPCAHIAVARPLLVGGLSERMV